MKDGVLDKANGDDLMNKTVWVYLGCEAWKVTNLDDITGKCHRGHTGATVVARWMLFLLFLLPIAGLLSVLWSIVFCGPELLSGNRRWVRTGECHQREKGLG